MIASECPEGPATETAPTARASEPSDAERDRYLTQIPSETTLAERRLLFRWFREKWNGRGVVVEVGPFLGGTSRAIAWGMLLNPQREPRTLLHTFDRFGDYYSEQRLRQTIEPLVRDGTFSPAQADDLCRGANFERLFNAIHSPHPYGALVKLHNSPLPDRPEELAATQALAQLADEQDLGALFIDGCKSWTSTHYAMAFLLPRTQVGAPVIFQDFGWYTCFWVSAAAYALRDLLEFQCSTDATYVFTLKRLADEEEIRRLLRPTAAAMGEKFFQAAANDLLDQSRSRGDLRGELISKLHHVAALATLGKKSKAAAVLKSLDVRRYAPFVNLIQGCLKSPTYLPGGKQILWNER